MLKTKADVSEDLNPQETAEWLESLDEIIDQGGPDRAAYLLKRLEDRATEFGVEAPVTLNTRYRNTSSYEEELPYPGDREIERRIKNWIRWNALAMVTRANKYDDNIGGHIATYASLATLTDLKGLPRPRAIEAAPSNSFSITALVAVLSVAEPRTVSTRFGSKTQVVTLTVGDPTRAPFRIDAWLEIRPKSVDAMELKAVVRELRIQDVIVVKNLRLGVWNNAVFGTTWRVGSRGGSALWLVHRLRWEGSDERRRWRRRWDEAVLAERKVANMIKWVKALVGSGPGLGMNGRVLREEEEQLPEDTQPRNSSLF